MKRSRLFAAMLLIAAWAFSGCAPDEAETGSAAPEAPREQRAGEPGKTAESKTPAAPVAEVPGEPEEKAAAPAGGSDPRGKRLPPAVRFAARGKCAWKRVTDRHVAPRRALRRRDSPASRGRAVVEAAHRSDRDGRRTAGNSRNVPAKAPGHTPGEGGDPFTSSRRSTMGVTAADRRMIVAKIPRKGDCHSRCDYDPRHLRRKPD